MNKRAVSPVIATVLLIVFAIILGVIVMNVGGSYLSVEDTSTTTESNTAIGIIDKCSGAGSITKEESDTLLNSLK